MDQARFDAIARALGGGMSRRGALAAALAALPAAGALAQGDDPAAAKKKRKRCRKDSPEGQCCTNKKGCRCDDGGVVCGAECCAGETVCISGACAASGCRDINDQVYLDKTPTAIFTGFLQQDRFVTMGVPERVVWFSRDGGSGQWVKRTIGSEGDRPDQFELVDGITGNPPATTLLVVDLGKDRISVWTRPDPTSTAWKWAANFGDSGPAADRLKEPTAVALTADWLTAVVSEAKSISIWRRSADDRQDWTFVKRIEGTNVGCGLGEIRNARKLVLSPDNLALFFLNCDKVQVWTRPDQGSDVWTPVAALGTFGSDALVRPGGIAADPTRPAIWVTDTETARVVEWVAQDAARTRWEVGTIFGPRGTYTTLKRPVPIAVETDGTILVGDHYWKTLIPWMGCGA